MVGWCIVVCSKPVKSNVRLEKRKNVMSDLWWQIPFSIAMIPICFWILVGMGDEGQVTEEDDMEKIESEVKRIMNGYRKRKKEKGKRKKLKNGSLFSKMGGYNKIERYLKG